MWHKYFEDCHYDILQHKQFKFTWFFQLVFVIGIQSVLTKHTDWNAKVLLQFINVEFCNKEENGPKLI